MKHFWRDQIVVAILFLGSAVALDVLGWPNTSDFYGDDPKLVLFMLWWLFNFTVAGFVCRLFYWCIWTDERAAKRRRAIDSVFGTFGLTWFASAARWMFVAEHR
jgi:hypothetical protein